MDIEIKSDNQPEKVIAGINTKATVTFNSQETNSLEQFRQALNEALVRTNIIFGPEKYSITAVK